MSSAYAISLDPPLRQLLWLQLKGKIRRTLRKLSSPRRAIPTAVVGVLMLLYCLQIYIALAFNPSTTSFPIRSIAPLGMLCILCLKLLGVCIDRTKSGAGFRSEEVHCLLGGPFRYQQARLYKVCGNAVSIFFTSIFAAIFFRFHVPSFAAALSGAYLAMLFTYLTYTAIAVAALHASDSVYHRLRNLGCGLALAVLAYLFYKVAQLNVTNIAFLQAFGDAAIVLSQSGIGRVFMAPFTVFTNVVVAESPLQWFAWVGPGLLLNYAALKTVMYVEVFFDERARARERSEFAKNREALVHQGVEKYAVDPERLTRTLPWLGGAGPIIWRQVKALSRLKGGLGWLLLPLGLAFAAGGYIAFDPEEGALQTIAVIVVLTSVFLPGLLPFDFRGDLKGLTALKMMPLNPRNVVLGQLVVPVVLLSLFQLVALSTLLLHDTKLITSVLLTMCFLIPTNTIILALENLIFLLYPYRVAEFDMQATVRRIVMLMAKFCVIFLAGLIAILAGLGVLGLKLATRSTMLEHSISVIGKPMMILTQLGATAALAGAVVWLTCWAYRRFDVSEDLPS